MAYTIVVVGDHQIVARVSVSVCVFAPPPPPLSDGRCRRRRRLPSSARRRRRRGLRLIAQERSPVIRENREREGVGKIDKEIYNRKREGEKESWSVVRARMTQPAPRPPG